MTKVAIVGRTNVGKSTFFNRLTGTKRAIVHDAPGVTRDRRTAKASLSDLKFDVIDTAGLEDGNPLLPAMWEQTQIAINEADVVLMFVDARDHITSLDKKLASDLRKIKKPVFLIANKCEGNEQFLNASEFFSLGLGTPIATSGEHGLGLADLYEALQPHIDTNSMNEEKSSKDIRIAIVGRPNVGKSTLTNSLLGENRMLTGPQAGMTRDAISSDFIWKDKKVQITDTAGLRKKGTISESLEKLSAADAKRALDFAEVVILVVDANQPLEHQDLIIGQKTINEGRALVIAVNKWDTVKNQKAVMTLINERLHDSLQQVKGIPVVKISALRNKGTDELLQACFDIRDVWDKRVNTGQLNVWLKQMTEAHPPPLARNGRRIPMKYMTQVKKRPPTFVIFSSNPDELPESYLRYLSNGLRENYGLYGVPIRIEMRKRNNPYADKKK